MRLFFCRQNNSPASSSAHFVAAPGCPCSAESFGTLTYWPSTTSSAASACDSCQAADRVAGLRGPQVTELKALLELGAPAVDRSAIRDLFTYRHIPAPKTIYSEIRKLPPAHTLVWQDGRLEIERYWTPDVTSEISDPHEAEEGLDAVLRTVMPEHLMSDVPVGVFLSGGLDSSVVAALLHDAGKPQTRATSDKTGDYTFFGQLKENTNVYVRLRYSF